MRAIVAVPMLALVSVTYAFAGSTSQVPGQTLLDSHVADAALETYGDCLVRSRGMRRKVESFLRTLPDTPAGRSAGAKINFPECLMAQKLEGPQTLQERSLENSNFAAWVRSQPVVQMAIPFSALQPALYGAAYRLQAKVPTADLSQLPALAIVDELNVRPENVPVAWRVRRSIGDCAVRADVLASHRMIFSKPWTAEETTTLPAVVMALRKCLPEGKTIAFGRRDIRAVIGEALYKLSRSQNRTTVAKEG